MFPKLFRGGYPWTILTNQCNCQAIFPKVPLKCLIALRRRGRGQHRYGRLLFSPCLACFWSMFRRSWACTPTVSPLERCPTALISVRLVRKCYDSVPLQLASAQFFLFLWLAVPEAAALWHDYLVPGSLEFDHEIAVGRAYLVEDRFLLDVRLCC